MRYLKRWQLAVLCLLAHDPAAVVYAVSSALRAAERAEIGDGVGDCCLSFATTRGEDGREDEGEKAQNGQLATF